MLEDEPRHQFCKTKAAVVDAFNGLVLTDRYEKIRVGDIVRESDVARSTFYEHFRDKDDVLTQSVAGIVEILSSVVEESPNIAAIEGILNHFQENRRLVSDMTRPPANAVIVSVLARQIEDRLPNQTTYVISKSSIAAQMAEGILGLIRGWLLNETTATSEQMTQAMIAVAHSLMQIFVPVACDIESV